MSFVNKSIYFSDSQNPESYSLENQIAEHLEFRLAKDKITITPKDTYHALALSVRDRMIRKWIRTQHEYIDSDAKKVSYLSLEYLMGRLLGNALTSMGFYDKCYDIMMELGYDLEDIIDYEHDMGLGNGGLGRLAACFLDSMATEELPAFGYGIRYEFGIFYQDIENGYQIEKPDNWLKYGNPWEIMRPEHTYRVKFGGKVNTITNQDGNLIFQWDETEDVLAVAWDIPIPGYKNNTVNNLRLWQAKSTEDFNFTFFNKGNYLKAVEEKNLSENISKVLYPNDNVEVGRELRFKQQYFFVSATLQDIIRKYKINHNTFDAFADKNAIHLNDTHPAIAIPELMRLLIDIEGLDWDKAWDVCTKTFAYTNHTVLSEALEKWPVRLFELLLPRHLQILYEINFQFLEKARLFFHNDLKKIRTLSIFEESDEKKIRMANLSIIGSHSLNGVAELHTEILKEHIFNDFYQLTPEKFNNKTNGITQRRWLRMANPYLSQVITDVIGDGWIKDMEEIRRLEDFADDSQLIENFIDAKWVNKKQLIDCLSKTCSQIILPDSMFDSQIKRLHEYKRQLLNLLHVITRYLRIKENPGIDIVPRTVIFSGKAAPGYKFAKLIIKLINQVAETINNDPEVNDKLRLVFMKNYSVTLAEKIIPATDLSEQISTAGFEASGTGNMKFQMNAALTIGTLDGANIEMLEEVGSDNIFIFGMNADEVLQKRQQGYDPTEYYNSNNELRAVINLIQNDFFSHYEPGIFRPITDSLLHQGDNYFVLADYADYIRAQEEADALFKDKNAWTRKAILNVARSSKFSSDRTIRQYANEIWGVTKVPISSKDLFF